MVDIWLPPVVLLHAATAVAQKSAVMIPRARSIVIRILPLLSRIATGRRAAL